MEFFRTLLRVPLMAIRAMLGLSRKFLFMIFLAVFIASHTLAFFTAMTTGLLASIGLRTVASTSLSATADLSIERVQWKKRVDRLETENLKLRNANLVVFRGENMTVREASSHVVSRVRTRTGKVATANIGSAVGEAVPFWGIGVIVAVTGYELNSACQTMKDLGDLQASLDAEGKFAAQDETDQVCGLTVPSKEEIWSKVKASPAIAWSSAKQAMGNTGVWAANLEAPEFGKWFSAAIGALSKVALW